MHAGVQCELLQLETNQLRINEGERNSPYCQTHYHKCLIGVVYFSNTCHLNTKGDAIAAPRQTDQTNYQDSKFWTVFRPKERRCHIICHANCILNQNVGSDDVFLTDIGVDLSLVTLSIV